MENDIRIQKVFSDKGIMSRRKTEEAIKGGRIMVNGRKAEIGQKIDPRKDIVAMDGKQVDLKLQVQNIYVMLNKPRGYVSTTSDTRERKTVIDLVKDVPQRVYPIGRLDLNSEGLILLTNDGEFANDIMHPKREVPKTYRASIRGKVNEAQLINLSTGVILDDGYKSMPATVHVVTEEPDRTVLQITVTEGRNRLIRRMCQGAGLDLTRLKRTAIGPIKLGMLKPGDHRLLTPLELKAIRGAIKKQNND